MTDLRGSDNPCDQGIHWIECEGCKMCGRSWDEAMEHAKQMADKEAEEIAAILLTPTGSAPTGSGGGGAINDR